VNFLASNSFSINIKKNHNFPTLYIILEHIFNVTKEVIYNLITVEQWMNKLMIFIPEDTTLRVDKQRPISLIEMWRKLTLGIPSKEIADKTNHLLSYLQFGFRKQRGTDQASSLVLGIIENTIKRDYLSLWCPLTSRVPLILS